MSTHVPGLLSFLSFFSLYFLLTKLATSSARVKLLKFLYHNVEEKYQSWKISNVSVSATAYTILYFPSSI